MSAKSTALATAGEFSPTQIKLVKTQLMVDKDGNLASNGELYMFLEVCKLRNLDPFKRQIYAVARWSQGRMRWAYQVSIEGLRGMAERTKERDGTEGPYWCGNDGEWTDVWLSDEAPQAAKVIIYRKGHRHPYTAIAQMSFYQQTRRDGTPTEMWSKGGGAHMLAKCAEALALRKGFPEECGGIYIGEEVDQLDSNVIDAAEEPQREKHNPDNPYQFMTEEQVFGLLETAAIDVLDDENFKSRIREFDKATYQQMIAIWQDRKKASAVTTEVAA